MSEIKSLKPMQRVKVVPPPGTTHPLAYQIGLVRGTNRTRRNAAGTVIFKSYDVAFGHNSTRAVESGYLYPIE